MNPVLSTFDSSMNARVNYSIQIQNLFKFIIVFGAAGPLYVKMRNYDSQSGHSRVI